MPCLNLLVFKVFRPFSPTNKKRFVLCPIFGWVNDAPEQVYVVPARELYDYNKDTGQVTFPAKEGESEKLERLKRFKKKDNRCLMYIE